MRFAAPLHTPLIPAHAVIQRKKSKAGARLSLGPRFRRDKR